MATPTDKETKINGFDVSVEFEGDGDDLVSSGFVCKGGRYGSSIEFVRHYGYIEGNSESDIIKISETTQEKIFKWAETNGY
ncbi:MAG: hypothetical protein GY804_03850 [Alphaproteobacteria bacterium]|nr:hypothetical protein [Alphaproteobacteria bacterium]